MVLIFQLLHNFNCVQSDFNFELQPISNNGAVVHDRHATYRQVPSLRSLDDK